jgi:LysM repeat protein
MSYTLFLADVMLPVTPAQLTLKIKNQNKTVNLINEGEVNLLKQAGLTEISFQALLPNLQYPFAQYTSGFKKAAYYLDHLKKLKTQTDLDGNFIPFQFKVIRAMPDGKILFDTDDMQVALEDYKITEAANSGFDVVVDVSLKQYRSYGTKTVTINQPTVAQPQATAQVEQARPAETAPQPKTYTVVKGDSLWAIAKKYLNNGDKYPEIYALNQAIIDARNKGTGNTKYTIYPGQVFTLP